MKKSVLIFITIFILIQLAYPVFCQGNDSKNVLENSMTNLNNFSMWDTFSILLGLFGAIGTGFTIYSFKESTKEHEINREIIEAAKKSLNKTAIERDIEKIKNQMNTYATENKEYQKNIELLKKQIEKDIPNEAKKAVLKGKLRLQEDLLIKTYDSILTIKTELNEVENNFQISPEIQLLIENEIRPDYASREELSRYKTQLLILTAGAIFASILISYPTDMALVFLFLVYATKPVIKIIKLEFSADYNKSIMTNLKYAYIILLALSLVITAIFVPIQMFYAPDNIDFFVVYFLTGIIFIGGLLSFAIYRLFKNYV